MDRITARNGATIPVVGENADGLDRVTQRGFLAGLSDQLVRNLLVGSPSVRYPKGTVISLGTHGPGAAIVASGLIRCYVAAPDGRQATVRYAGPGDLLGTLKSAPSQVPVYEQAVESSELIHLNVERVRQQARQHPELGLALHDELSDRLPVAIRALAANAFLSVMSRVASDLVDRAQASGTLCQGARLKVTQQDVADATGSVREVVARAVQKLRQKGIIATHNGGITLIDPPALVRTAQAAPPRRLLTLGDRVTA